MTYAALAAIHFALEDDDGIAFLRYWNEGEFDVLRRNWPDAPDEVYIGADPLHPETYLELGVAAVVSETNASKPPKGGEFPAGMTVRQLKDLIAQWPEVDRNGEPCEVWMDSGGGGSNPVGRVFPLNSRCDEQSYWADILFTEWE